MRGDHSYSVDDLVEPSSDCTSFLVKDVQGLGDLYFARQHLVHLPKDGTRDDAFDGMGRLGPDIVPYSDTQLMTAFRSEAVLGLQLWNEDHRLATEHDSGFPLRGTDLPFGFSKFRWGHDAIQLPTPSQVSASIVPKPRCPAT